MLNGKELGGKQLQFSTMIRKLLRLWPVGGLCGWGFVHKSANPVTHELATCGWAFVIVLSRDGHLSRAC